MEKNKWQPKGKAQRAVEPTDKGRSIVYFPIVTPTPGFQVPLRTEWQGVAVEIPPSWNGTTLHTRRPSYIISCRPWHDIDRRDQTFLICRLPIVPQGHLRVCLYNFVLSVKSSNITRALIHYLATSGALQANVSNLVVQQLCFWTSVKAAVSDIFVLK